MKKILSILLVSMAVSPFLLFASDIDQLPQGTIEGQTISSRLSTQTGDPSDSSVPAPSAGTIHDLSTSHDNLSHEGLSAAPQSKSFFQYLNIFSLFNSLRRNHTDRAILSSSELSAEKEPGASTLPVPKAERKDAGGRTVAVTQAVSDELTHQTLSGQIPGKGDSGVPPADNVSVQTKNYPIRKSSESEPDDLMYQSLNTEVQGRDILSLYASTDDSKTQSVPAQQPPSASAKPNDAAVKDSQVLLAMKGNDDLSHQALSSAVQDKTAQFYFVKASGAVPMYDKAFRNFLDYGASVSVGAGKHINKNLSLNISLDILLLTGDWSIAGDRESVMLYEESWLSDRVSGPEPTTISAEDVGPTTGDHYIKGESYIVKSSESLKQIDIHTDLYIFPISFNALYKFNNIGKFSPYIGGGLGYCIATRDSDSRAIKSKYFEGPDYGIRMNNSQTRTGMLLNFLGGFSLPVYKNLNFIAEGNMTYYDIKSFDPILEISFTRPANPQNIGGSDISVWSYEDPKRIGKIGQEFVGRFTVGFVMPF